MFTPIAALAVFGLLSAIRARERWLPATLLTAAAAHWVLMGLWGEWHGGRAWGPRLMTDALPRRTVGWRRRTALSLSTR